MKAKLICYTLGRDAAKRTFLHRRLKGWTDHSNMGRFKYERRGTLHKIKHITPIRSVIIVNPKDEKSITQLLDLCNAKYYVFDVYLKPKDAVKLK